MIRQGANVTNITDPGYLSDFVRDFGVLSGPYFNKNQTILIIHLVVRHTPAVIMMP